MSKTEETYRNEHREREAFAKRDRSGPEGSTRKHPGLIWAAVALAAIVALCVAFAVSGDWFTPSQAQQEAQTQFEEETVPEDLGANENPEAMAQK